MLPLAAMLGPEDAPDPQPRRLRGWGEAVAAALAQGWADQSWPGAPRSPQPAGTLNCSVAELGDAVHEAVASA